MGTRRQVSFAKGKSGLCEVRELKNFLKLMTDDGDTLEIEYENVLCPHVAGVGMFFKTNAAGTLLYELRPQEGDFSVKFHSFPAKKDELPKPYKLRPRDLEGGGRTREREVFGAMFEVQAGKYESLLVRGRYAYDFNREVSGQMWWDGKGSWGEVGEKFLTICGFDWDNDVLMFDEELLKNLEILFHDKDLTFLAEVAKGGFVQSLRNFPEGMEPTK